MMPWKQVWEDAPKDMNLPVHKELPDGIADRDLGLVIKEAWGTTEKGFRTFHFCPHCDGWIEGHAHTSQVSNLSPHMLAGRQGTEYYCRRCGREIGFMGLMS